MLVAAFLSFALAAQPSGLGDQQPDHSRRISISTTATHALTYPLIASVRICNSGALTARGIGQDLSLLPTPRTGVFLQFNWIDGQGKPVLFGTGKDQSVDIWQPGVSVHLKTGECLNTTVDVLELGGVRRHGFAESRHLEPGVWEISVPKFMAEFGDVGNTTEILIREPSEAERSVAEALGASKGGRPFTIRWAVLHPEVEIPDDSSLPIETRRIVELIEALRSAVDSPEQGLFMIDEEAANGMDWGFLAPFIDELRYECLLLAGDEEKATALKRELSSSDAVDLTLSRIEDGDGVVAGFLKAKESEERNREVRQPLTNP